MVTRQLQETIPNPQDPLGEDGNRTRAGSVSVLEGGPRSDTAVMRQYGQYCPVAQAAEVIGDRWTLLIVRELMFGPLGFDEFTRGLPGISRSVLAARLRHLGRAGVVEQVGGPGGKIRAHRCGRPAE